MSCNIIRNSNNTISSVLTREGSESELFNQINTNLFLGGSSEVSLNLFMAVDSLNNENVIKNNKNEPKMFFKNENGNVFEDMEEALINTESGKFEFGVIDSISGFIKAGDFNTNSSTVSGFLAKSVKEGTISTNRNYDALTGESFIVGKGEYYSSIRASQSVFADNLAEELGLSVKITKNGLTILENTNPYVQVIKSDGSVEVMSKDDAKESLKYENIINKADIFLRTEDLHNKIFKPEATTSISSLTPMYKNNLLAFLNNMGFSITSLEEYQTSYEVRHGNTIGVEGLIDIANKVVAIAEGVDITSVMTEEVAHLVIEAYSDQDSIAEALVDVVETQEYRDYAEKYRNKYSDEYQGIALEEKVRKEILGKVLAKEMLNSNVEIPSNYILDIWERFVEFLRSRFNLRKRVALDTLINKIKTDFNEGNTENFNYNLKGNDIYFSLSANKDIQESLKRVSQKFKGISDASKKTGSQTIISSNEIRFVDNLTEIDTLNQINNIISVLKTNLQTFDIKSRDSLMSATDFNIFSDLYKLIFPELENFLQYISKGEFLNVSNKQIANAVSEDLKRTMEGFSLLNSRIKADTQADFINTLSDYIENNENLTDEQKKEVAESFNNQVKDISIISRLFSPLSESQSPYVRLVARVITDMYTSVDSRFRQFAHNASDMFDKNGWRVAQKNIVSSNSYFLNDYYDHQAMENAIVDEVAEYISTTTGTPIKEVKDLLKNDKPTDVIETILKKQNPSISEEELINKKDNVEKEYRRARYNNKTHRFSQEKIDNDDKLKSIANVSDDSFIEYNSYRQQLNDITSKYYNNGKLDLNSMSEADRAGRDRIISARQVRLSPISASGEIMDGLEVKTWEEMSLQQRQNINNMSQQLVGEDLNPESIKKTKFVVLQDGVELDSLSIDARYSLDMNNFNLVSMIQRESNPEEYGRVVSEDIYTNINNYVDSIKKGVTSEFFQAELQNYLDEVATTDYTQDFYDEINTNSINFVDNAQKQIDNELDSDKKWELQQNLDAYKKLSTQKSEIIKAYRSKSNSTEVEVNNLTEPIRTLWIEMDEQISSIRRKFETEEMKPESLTTRVLSTSFVKMQEESGKSEYEFSLNHMSQRRKLDVQNFKNYLEISATNSNIRFNKRFEETIDEIRSKNTEVDFDSMSDREIIDIFSTEYAKQNLASYFYGNELKDLSTVKSDIINSLVEGEIEIEDLFSDDISKVSKYLKYTVRPEFAEYNTPERFLDKEYNPIKGSMPRDKFKKPEFLQRYGITEEDYNNATDVTELVANNNVGEFKLLQFLVQNNKDANEKYQTTTNIMLRPQITKSGYEKVKGAYKYGESVGNIKETIKESFSDRVDELVYGDTDFSNVGLKVIPKMHRRRVDEPQQLTGNLFEASMEMLRQSELYIKKLDTKRRVDAIITQAENREYVKGGLSRSNIKVKGELSQTVQALKEIADNYLYGVKQDSKMEINVGGMSVDMTRFLSKVQGLSSKINLGYSVMIPLTSLTTGVYNNIENNLVREYYSKSSVNRARASLPGDAIKYISAEGQIYSKSKLGALIEMFGLKSAGERFNNSASSRGERIFAESMFLLDNIANVPVLYQSLYATLYDYRYFESNDGSKKGFMNYAGFEAYLKTTRPDISQSDIKSAWKNIENKSFMDAIDFNSNTGEISIKKEYTDKLAKEKIERTIQDIGAKVRIIGQQVDGVMNETDKVLASRNAILNTLLQHRGFLFVNLARAFKGKRYSFANSRWEEGHYTSVFNMFMNMIQSRGNVAKAFGNLDSSQKRNIVRVGFRSAAAILILNLAKYLKATDDDDDTFAEDLSRIITYRTYNEVADLSPLGMGKTLMSSIKQPIVLYDTLESVYKAGEELIDREIPWEEKDWSKIRKLTMIGKTYDQLSDLDTYTNSWLFYKQTDIPELYNYKTEDDY